MSARIVLPGALVVLAVPVILYGLGSYSLVNGDEGIYHGMARRMVETGDWFRLEFAGEWRVYDTFTHAPLFLWCKALAILVLGDGYVAMRVVSAGLGILSLLATYRLVLHLANERAAFLAGVVQLTTFQFVFLHASRTGEMETALTLCFTLAVFFFLRAVETGRSFVPHHLCLVALLNLKLAIVVVPVLAEALYFALEPAARRRLRDWIVTACWLLPLGLVWHLYQTFLHGEELVAVVREMLGQSLGSEAGFRHEVGLLGQLGFYARHLVFGTWPWAFLYPWAFVVVWSASRRESSVGDWKLVAAFIAAVAVFFLAIALKAPWYTMPAVPMLSAFLGAALDRRLREPPGALEVGVVGVLLVLTAGVRFPILDFNPFAVRATAVTPVLAWGVLDAWTAGVLLLVAVASIAALRLREGRLRLVALLPLAALLLVAGVRTVAPLQFVSHQTPMAQVRAEIDAAQRAGSPLAFPIGIPERDHTKARFYFADEFAIRAGTPRHAEPRPRLRAGAEGRPLADAAPFTRGFGAHDPSRSEARAGWLERYAAGPMETQAERRLAAMLSADAVGYSRLVSQDEVLATRHMGECRERIGTWVGEHGGRVVDAVGDNLLAEFRSAADAVRCAIAVQAGLGRRNAELDADARLPFRIGIEVGEVLVDEGRVAGECVNVAARLESLAPVGGLAMSSTVRDQLAGRVELDLQELGEWRLHNIPRPVLVLCADLGGGDAPAGAVEGNLPSPRTSFVGRERARSDLTGLVSRERLVTLTGLGGAGKTRLALEVAQDAASSFEGGIWWVELQALSDEQQVAGTIANVVSGGSAPSGMSAGGAAEEQSARAIGHRRTLLVLDNCEHVVDACADLADELLSQCTMLTILATSREPLEVGGERVWQVAPLDVPDDEIALGDALECEAIALFLDRARSARADFALTDANLASVRQICARLDGIPLAIELAAVRVRHLSPEEIARRLEDRFGLLVARRRRSERRHQTLEAALDWSHDLLDEPSRALFRRLAIFPGRFPLDAAEGCCADAPVSEGQVLELLGGLVDRSFVTPTEVAGETRYRLLETVREYAAGKLDAAGERDAMRALHAGWFATRAVTESAEVFGERGLISLWGGDALSSRVELLDDFVLATEWSLRQAEPLDAKLPITTLALLRVSGRVNEALALGERITHDAMNDHDRALLRMGMASSFTHRGDFASAYVQLEQVVELATLVGRRDLVVAALGNMLVASIVAGKDSTWLAEKLRAEAAEVGETALTGFAEGMVGAFHLIEGRFAEARDHLSRSVRIDPRRASLAHGYAIVASLLAGDPDAAARAFAMATELEPPVNALARANFGWNPLRSLALWHAWTGDLDEARRVEARALAYQAAKPMPLAEGDHLVTLAAIAFFAGDAEQASRLLGAARRAMGEYRSWRGHDAGPLYLHLRGRCDEALGREAAGRLRREGLASDPTAMLAEARRGLA